MTRPDGTNIDPTAEIEASEWTGVPAPRSAWAAIDAAAPHRAKKVETSQEDPATEDGPSLADFIDALRVRTSAPFDNIEPAMTLSDTVLERLEKCAFEFERESGRLIHRRSHVGALVFPASPAEVNAVNEFFAQRLRLRIVDVDVRSLLGLSDAEVERTLATLTDPTAHIVALRGLGPDTDPRVLEAIEWGDVDVLVIAYSDSNVNSTAAVRRRLKHRIDLHQPGNVRWGTRGGVPGFF
jgi:hypothetical protein